MNVLVVDDNLELQALVERSLLRDGHRVLLAASVREARQQLSSHHVDVMVLDLGLPGESGVVLCRELRAAGSGLPILVLTAKTRVASRVESLDAGADDHLGKPFAVAELRARVRALGRRGTVPRRAPLKLGECELDFATRSAKYRGFTAPVTLREWEILELLGSRAGALVTRAELLQLAWQGGTAAAESSLEVLISRIRRKLGPNVVRTVRGQGYALGDG